MVAEKSWLRRQEFQELCGIGEPHRERDRRCEATEQVDVATVVRLNIDNHASGVVHCGLHNAGECGSCDLFLGI
jgi:hypothetical protein